MKRFSPKGFSLHTERRNPNQWIMGGLKVTYVMDDRKGIKPNKRIIHTSTGPGSKIRAWAWMWVWA